MNALQYLQAAKIEELTEDLQKQGYSVTAHPGGSESGFDVVAAKNQKRIAIQVMAKSELGERASEISRMREMAKQMGFTEFRVLIVSPPRERHIEIDGIDDALLNYLLHEHPAQELMELSSDTQIENIHDVEIDSLTWHENEMQATGTAVVSAELSWAGGESRDGAVTLADFPLTFKAILDSERKIKSAEIRVDTSDWYGPQ